MSTHSPYDKYIGEDLHLIDTSLSENYKNYLNTCHYTDNQIRQYFEELKLKGLFDSSLIVIASDHYAHLDMLNMIGKISNHTPLFIINGDICIEKAWKGECHQLDTYTTLMDMLGIEQPWVGLGHTLLDSYKCSVDETVSNISELIIEGDYFAE